MIFFECSHSCFCDSIDTYSQKESVRSLHCNGPDWKFHFSVIRIREDGLAKRLSNDVLVTATTL